MASMGTTAAAELCAAMLTMPCDTARMPESRSDIRHTTLHVHGNRSCRNSIVGRRPPGRNRSCRNFMDMDGREGRGALWFQTCMHFRMSSPQKRPIEWHTQSQCRVDIISTSRNRSCRSATVGRRPPGRNRSCRSSMDGRSVHNIGAAQVEVEGGSAVPKFSTKTIDTTIDRSIPRASDTWAGDNTTKRRETNPTSSSRAANTTNIRSKKNQTHISGGVPGHLLDRSGARVRPVCDRPGPGLRRCASRAGPEPLPQPRFLSHSPTFFHARVPDNLGGVLGRPPLVAKLRGRLWKRDPWAVNGSSSPATRPSEFLTLGQTHPSPTISQISSRSPDGDPYLPLPAHPAHKLQHAHAC
jgi:hypothetical protein